MSNNLGRILKQRRVRSAVITQAIIEFLDRYEKPEKQVETD
ncbi:hypothetical protein ES703_64951 [subsurface metagenome]